MRRAYGDADASGPNAAKRALSRVWLAWTQDERRQPALLAVLVGMAGFGLSAWIQGALGLFSRGTTLALIAWALLIEETIRFAWCLGFALLARRHGYPELALLGVVAAAIFAAAENLAFYAASPDSSVWARLIWSTPTHLNAALLATLALGALARGAAGGFGSTVLRLSLGFALALVWHGAYNVGALLGPSPPALALGGAFNTLAFFVLLGRASTWLGAPRLLDTPQAPGTSRPERQGDPHGNA